MLRDVRKMAENGFAPGLDTIAFALPSQSRRASVNKAFMMYNDALEFDFNAVAPVLELDPAVAALLQGVPSATTISDQMSASVRRPC